MRLKLDLHTHCQEALFYAQPTLETAQRIVEAVKAKGLDGIAITEHENAAFGYKIKELVEEHLGKPIIIVPGCEVDVARAQIVELYFPEGLVFRFLAHPGYPWSIRIEDYLDQIQGIEVDNGLHRVALDLDKIDALAQKYDLLLLSNSDAHSLQAIGEYYNYIDLEELRRRACAPMGKDAHHF
ncbi:MAG TPA: hypothetical protein G4O03_04960 [Dehalococcoidia bacterium]|nr:hypothetical protein [Dehalococcoidia bacterium]